LAAACRRTLCAHAAGPLRVDACLALQPFAVVPVNNRLTSPSFLALRYN
jgi:hypothetical protein